MVVKLSGKLAANAKVKIEKYSGAKDVSVYGAFSDAEKIRWVVKCDREIGATSVSMRLHRDGENDRDILLEWTDSGSYEITLKMSDLGIGLYFYTFVVWRGREALYTVTYDNVNFNLSDRVGKYFMLTVYDRKFTTPSWFHGGTMYQIFPDRFYKSGKADASRSDAVYEEDWAAPISQYALYPGGPLENNLFYGGDLYGVAEKLEYLKSMGVTVIYLNPIFKAYSNHRYDTGDYRQVDPGVGGDEALKELIAKAEEFGIKVILDGVFNHTGDDSIYFNRKGKYDALGAYQSEQSPYYDWFTFKGSRDSYDCWWGIDIMPRLNHHTEACRKYFTADDGVCADYVRMGTGGWRLDVADELPDVFLDELRASVKKTDPDAVIIGEVWENAADKIAYGSRRRYVQGGQLDSVMNYPFRTSVINFAQYGNSADLANTLTCLYASYPKCVSDSLMNIVGTHDTDRILTELGDGEHKSLGLTNAELSVRKMSPENRKRAVMLLKIISTIQYTVYGVPSLYYGDEAGVEGYHDPFCRATFPWGSEDETLMKHYKRLGIMRKREKIFAEGSFRVLKYYRGFIMYERTLGDDRVIVAANINKNRANAGFTGVNIINNDYFRGVVPPETAVVIRPFDEEIG